jgi:hypothetical protein
VEPNTNYVLTIGDKKNETNWTSPIMEIVIRLGVKCLISETKKDAQEKLLNQHIGLIFVDIDKDRTSLFDAKEIVLNIMWRLKTSTGSFGIPIFLVSDEEKKGASMTQLFIEEGLDCIGCIAKDRLGSGALERLIEIMLQRLNLLPVSLPKKPEKQATKKKKPLAVSEVSASVQPPEQSAPKSSKNHKPLLLIDSNPETNKAWLEVHGVKNFQIITAIEKIDEFIYDIETDASEQLIPESIIINFSFKGDEIKPQGLAILNMLRQNEKLKKIPMTLSVNIPVTALKKSSISIMKKIDHIVKQADLLDCETLIRFTQ